MAVDTWDFPAQPPAGGTTATMARMEERRQDAAKLSVPIQMFLAAICTALALGGVYWQATGGVRSRLDLMSTKMDAAAEISKTRDDYNKAQLEAMKDEIKSLRGKSDLLQLQQQQIQLELAAIKAGRR